MALPTFFSRWKREALFFAGLSLVWLSFHAPYRFWEGGWSWGPRLMLPILPFLLLSLGALNRSTGITGRLGSRLFPVAIAAGLAVQLLGTSVDYTRYLWATYSDHAGDAYARVVYQPMGSPLVGQWLDLASVTGNAVRRGELESARQNIAQKLESMADLPEAEKSVAVLTETQVAGLNFPDFWFIYLYLFGAPLVPVAFIAAVLLLGTGGTLLVLDRRLRELRLEKDWSG